MTENDQKNINLALAQRDFELWNTGNLSIADEIYAAEYRGHFIGGWGWKGIEELKQVVTGLRKNIPDWHASMDDTVVEGNRVAVRFTCVGTPRGEFVDLPATGTNISFPSMVFYRMDEGKIIETWEYIDYKEAQRQMKLAQQK